MCPIRCIYNNSQFDAFIKIFMEQIRRKNTKDLDNYIQPI